MISKWHNFVYLLLTNERLTSVYLKLEEMKKLLYGVKTNGRLLRGLNGRGAVNANPFFLL
jgi:hypothetical protein